MPAASIRDVAARAGVSVGTVSNVLNRAERVSPDAASRVMAAISELGYVRNDAARQLRAGRSKSVALVVLDVRNPFFTDIARGVEGAAAARGLTVLLGNSDENAERESAHIDTFEEQRVFGLVVVPFDDIDDRLRRLRDRGTPTVVIDRQRADRPLSSVSVDDVAGGRLACAHLLEIGRRRIGFVGGPVGNRGIADRLAGGREAVAAVPGATLEVLETTAGSVYEGRRIGAALSARPPADRPDAVFCANDMVALGLMQALTSDGTARVPRDLAVVGFDDIDVAASAMVPLSSVRQPSRLIGETAVQILVDEAADPTLEPRHVSFQPELVVRESTAG
jgi:LacI family transcriptional regulator